MATALPKAAAPSVLPWAAVAILFLTPLGTAVIARLVAADGALPALIGAICALVGALMSPKGQMWAPVLAGAAACATLLLGPGPVAFWAICLLLCVAAGIEVTQTGGRAMVMMLFAWLSVQMMAAMPPLPTALPFLAGGFCVGWIATIVFKMRGVAAQGVTKRRYGLGLSIFLALGIAVAVVIARHLDNPFSHWVVLIFVMRALAPQGQAIPATIRFGLGAAMGCATALTIIALHPPHALAVGAAFVLFLAGLRLVPHPQPWAPAAFSAAILLIVAPDVQPALFRLEITALIVTLSIVLAASIAYLIEWFEHQAGL